LESRWFQALEKALEEEWGVIPLRIREGGSIPSIPFLEKTFGCPALHLPLGQSSVSPVTFAVLIRTEGVQDQAHLANERMSVNNLLKGKAVLERFFRSVASDERNI
jgi:di- and tripeptidase